jgi:hypothetical protein
VMRVKWGIAFKLQPVFGLKPLVICCCRPSHLWDGNEFIPLVRQFAG